MDEQTEQIINSPKFKALLAKRSRLRWGFTTLLVASYVAYGFSGVWFPEAMSRPFLGTAMTWIMAVAYFIMLLSVCSAVYYVRVIGKLHAVRRGGASNG